MSHATCTQGNRVDSRFLVVESQIVNLTLGPSFGHNLCFRCPNGSCKPILNIYVSIIFQWYRELLNPLGFDPCNLFLNIQKSTGTPILGSQGGSSLGSVRVHSPTFAFIPKLPLLARNLASPRLGLQHS
jgi:hypothetical protein